MLLNGIYTRLVNISPNVFSLSDLRNNEITEIEDGALEGATMLQDLLLGNNQLRQIRPKMFASLRNLTTLFVFRFCLVSTFAYSFLFPIIYRLLQDNQITCITNDSFSDLEALRIL